ncbi:MAG: J domain-containing protein [Spirochaetota bacterium]
MNSYYEILKIDASSSSEQIKRAFRKRAKELHPDVNRDVGDAVDVESPPRVRDADRPEPTRGVRSANDDPPSGGSIRLPRVSQESTGGR